MTSLRNILIIVFCFVYAGLVFASFNKYTIEIFDFNAGLRNFFVHGEYRRTTFDSDGIPSISNPRYQEAFTSPFYVVHFGLAYSENCTVNVRGAGAYHWLDDKTLQYWPSPQDSSLERFKSTVEWLYERVDFSLTSHAHFLYDFDWFYAGYSAGVIRAPWWSGLTDGHAIVLFLRAYDCLGDPRYRELARQLYESVTAPISRGGSLIMFQGRPWIEEYVDPRGNEAQLPRVLNGMAYAYFGVRAYEEYIGTFNWSEPLADSLKANISAFDSGYWSDYDAIGNAANIKYHNINRALLEDPRLYDESFDPIISRWRTGSNLPLLFFTIYGPNSIAKYHYFLSYLALTFLPIGTMLVWRPLRSALRSSSRLQYFARFGSHIGPRATSYLFIIPAALVQFQSFKRLAFIYSFTFLFFLIIQSFISGNRILSSRLVFVSVYFTFIVYMSRAGNNFDINIISEYVYLSFGLLYLSIIVFSDKIDVDYAVGFLVHSSSVIGGILIVLHAQSLYPSYFLSPPYAGTRWVGGFDGPNEFSQFYALVFAIHLGRSLANRKYDLYFWIVSAILLICAWFGYSRGALFSTAILLVLFLFLFYRGSHIYGIIVISGVLILGVAFSDILAQHFDEVRARAGGRDHIWEAAYRLFLESPFFGSGIGGFSTVAEVSQSTPHNGYLYFLIVGGIIALCAFVAFLSYLIYESYRSGDYASFLFFVTFSLHELTFNNLVRGRVSVLFWIMVVVVFLCREYRVRRVSVSRSEESEFGAQNR